MSKKNRNKKSSPKKNTKIKKVSKVSWYKQKGNLLLLAGILLLTVIAFSPTFYAEFVNWDDSVNIYENQYVMDFDIPGIFSNHVIGNYNPISILSFAIDWALVGNDPTWYHIENVLFHLLNIILVFGLFWKLGFGKIGSVVVAVLFAIHPMRVESVAWVTERKDVLYAFFYLLSIHTYLRYKDNSNSKTLFLILTYVFFILSGLSKIQAVTLPLSLILIDYWRAKDVNWIKWTINKIPFFIISLGIGLLGVYFLREQGSLMISQEQVNHNFIDKLVIGFNGLGQYLIKSIVPYEMVAIYPFPSKITLGEYLGASLGLLFLGLCIYLIFKPKKPWTFGFLFFLANVIFMLQFVDAGQGYKADRFTYIPYLGIFAIIGYFIQNAYKPQNLKNAISKYSSKYGKYALYSFGIVSLVYSYVTYGQTKVWHDSESLWKHQIKYYQVPLPYTNLANFLRDQGKSDEAMKYYNEAIRIKPTRATSYNSRGKLYFSQGKFKEALNDYMNAVKYENDNAEYYSNRGAAYANLGDMNNAMIDFNKAIELNPNRDINYMNRALVYKQLNDLPKAYADFQSYANINPNEPDIHYELALLSNDLKQHQRALNEIQRAISMNPNKGIYYMERSRTYFFMNNMQAAKKDMLMSESLGYKVQPAYKQRLMNY